MINLDWCFNGDKVEILEDYKDYGGKTIARKGDIAIVSSTQMSLNEHIRIDLEGKRVSRYVPTWILQIIEKDEKARQYYIEREKIKEEKQASFNLHVGDLIILKGFSYDKTPLYKAKITRLAECGVYAYKINKNGDRYKGKMGEEELHLFSEILTDNEVATILKENQEKQERKENESQYKIGMFIPHTFRGWGMVTWIGQIVDVKPRTIFIDYGDNPYDWHTKEEKKWFRNSIETKEQVQDLINEYGIMDTAINRAKELDYIVNENTKIYEIIDKYPRLKSL